ncbi:MULTISPECIES: phage shock protein operon transcriptional activator [unclassified Shewanella]|uniref:phage shock protein operon transcriptional activator n=1 Tax=unclassified Shewanella TaxID=196818 RepID=UPI000C82E2AE|nr:MULTISPECIES: phage shock protein operon transcriptional activator [unclassified Shewanella]MDO6617842.1 phage shock protein operon transcriptional activator [Shewanella sp. 6_MG-2023]MDO6639278.1 phage shock protein operon transcriptional activator [Shewanella sp. 5_MG-2023]MDO6677530.1 phage shock protein operon transcriptional activator [Shewanella sp. 4_MG-2023]PMG29436.1 phage shock protein operon transcriptional activator [Shewanella sp. 10N.286.52.C2]PMG41303.1 phage shock protein op
MTKQFEQDNLIGQSNALLEVLEHVSKVAPLSKPVLIIGERGTGKELIAERLHYLSGRWDKEFIKLNCSSLSESLLESELFGHESGAFTGAKGKHEGRFERADEGTLFLDELANTSGLIQEKLLRVIEYGEFERVGGSKTVNTNVRLICAANEDLPSLAENGEFRADLLDRLAFDVITLPPLRSRTEDIMPLAEHFAVSMARQLNLDYFGGFSPVAIEQLMSYRWPGNIRELKNVVERSVYRRGSEGEEIDHIIVDPFASPYRPTSRIKTRERQQTEHQAPDTSVAVPVTDDSTENEASSVSTSATDRDIRFPLDFKEHTENYEINLLKSALAQSQYNQKKTAEILGLSYHQLRGILKKYNLLEKS